MKKFFKVLILFIFIDLIIIFTPFMLNNLDNICREILYVIKDESPNKIFYIFNCSNNDLEIKIVELNNIIKIESIASNSEKIIRIFLEEDKIYNIESLQAKDQTLNIFTLKDINESNSYFIINTDNEFYIEAIKNNN